MRIGVWMEVLSGLVRIAELRMAELGLAELGLAELGLAEFRLTGVWTEAPNCLGCLRDGRLR